MNNGQNNNFPPYSGGPAPQQQPPYGAPSDPYAAQRVAAGTWNRQAGPAAARPLDAADQNRFITKVFGWMTMGLGLTAFVAWFTAHSEAMINLIFGTPGLVMFLFIAQLGMVFGLSWGIRKLSVGVATGMFLLYSAMMGLTLASIFLVYTMGSIAATFAVTTGTFGFMFVWGWVTKKDLTKIGSIAFMALIGIILASFANFFLRSEGLYWIITYAGVLIFVALIAYDAQKLKQLNAYGDSGEVQQKNAILGALTLYLDFINLFIFLLRILGDRR
ncbi:MAG: Bax inhibitor-1/YccA family protein [Deltaproteobacteria bacterium]|nr:MAG: Bax inhibitor-1/YccA family protein [Deltaproteobacteria bacterium]